MSHRVYEFELPYTIPGAEISMGGLSQLKSLGIYDKLPADLKKKLDDAGVFHSPVVTKEDVDRIDDHSWQVIAEKLGLKWHTKK